MCENVMQFDGENCKFFALKWIEWMASGVRSFDLKSVLNIDFRSRKKIIGTNRLRIVPIFLEWSTIFCEAAFSL